MIYLDGLIFIPEFLEESFSSESVVTLASCTFVCETSCEDDYEGCNDCERCESACQVSIQGCKDCEDACEDSSQVLPGGATLTLNGGNGTFKWTISGLSQSFTTGNGYVRAGITKYQLTVGGVSSISGIVDYKNATSSGSTSVSQTTSYSPGTYTLWGFVETQLGGYWPAGVATVTIANDTFNWTYAGADPATERPIYGDEKESGLKIYITAPEWNELVDLVDAATGSNIPYVDSGDSISAVTVNKVAKALGVSTVSPGKVIKASFFNSLRTAYNSI